MRIALNNVPAAVADPGGVRLDQTNPPPLRPDLGVVAENARTGCIRVVYRGVARISVWGYK